MVKKQFGQMPKQMLGQMSKQMFIVIDVNTYDPTENWMYNI